MELNVRELYDAANSNIELDVQDTITRFNIAVFKLIEVVLNNEPVAALMHECYSRFVQLVRASETKGVDSNDILTVVDDTSKDLMQEFATKDNPVQSMCYLIGTNSEIPQNYTMTERMIILTAMLRFNGVNLIF